MRFSVPVILLLGMFYVAHGTRNACQQAYDECDFKFRFYGDVPTFDIWFDPNEHFTTKIQSKDRSIKIGILNSNGIPAEFINNDGSISLMSSEGNPRFTPNHFRPYRIPYQRGSGIGHQTLNGNQQNVAAGRCIRVFFSMYQVLRNRDTVSVNINAERSDFKCVVFRTI